MSDIANNAILTCKFIDSSTIFQDCPNAYELFCECDPNCTWGSNNRTMVTPSVIINALDNADVVDENEGERDEVNLVLERLKSLPEDMYIDLEN